MTPKKPNSERLLDTKPQMSASHFALLKQLLDANFKPAMVLGKSEDELTQMLASARQARQPLAWSTTTTECIALLQANDLAGLTQRLQFERAQVKLSQFIQGTVAPLLVAVGEAWSQGIIAVFQEHLFTELITRMLSVERASIEAKPGYPRMLFATPAEEFHALGILMAECVMAEHGAYCTSVGPQTPIGELSLAAQAWHADIVAISFSFSFPTLRITPLLTQLRQQLPATIAIWAGGAGIAHLDSGPEGVRIFRDLQEPLPAMLAMVR